jgi:predicted HicB family RNase H-like nuclease
MKGTSKANEMASQGEKFLHHGGYYGSVEVNLEDELLHGRLMYIRDAITYEGTDLASLKTAFTSAVDNYLAFCTKVGDEPDKPFSGTFNVRIPQTLHRDAAITADKAGISLNKLVEEAIRQRLVGTDQSSPLLFRTG